MINDLLVTWSAVAVRKFLSDSAKPFVKDSIYLLKENEICMLILIFNFFKEEIIKLEQIFAYLVEAPVTRSVSAPEICV